MFRPKIIGFVCRWSLPEGVGIAAPTTIHGYPKIRIVRVMCAGRIDPTTVLETFAAAADGILVVGCHPPDCHYVEGNLQAERIIKMLKRLLLLTGLEPERLRLDWAYPFEIERFAEIIDDFRVQVTALGPSRLAGERPDTDVLLNMRAAKAAAEDFRLRVLVGRERELTERENVYGEKVSQEEFDALLHEVVDAEFMRHKIYLLTVETPMSVKEIATITNMKPDQVLRHVVNMRRKGMIALDHLDGATPLYRGLGGQ
jgi:F420-non-reducing hydrogenase iron-sulfur subunit